MANSLAAVEDPSPFKVTVRRANDAVAFPLEPSQPAVAEDPEGGAQEQSPPQTGTQRPSRGGEEQGTVWTAPACQCATAWKVFFSSLAPHLRQENLLGNITVTPFFFVDTPIYHIPFSALFIHA